MACLDSEEPMSQRYKPYDHDQPYLLPPSMRDWLPPGDLAYLIIDVVDALDLSAIYAYYERDPKTGRPKAASGQPAFHPKMMVALLLYGYANGTPSSRRIARLCERDVGYRVMSADQQPDFRTISEFRRIHLAALEALFVQVLHLAREAGLVKLGHVALDGTKVKANASKHAAMSYARMQEAEKRYEQEIAELLARAEAADAEEDARYGKHRRGDELPEELRFRQTRLARIREAKAALEAAAREKARAEGKLDEHDEPIPPKRGRPPKTPPGVPKPTDQRNFTDPDSRIMKMASGAFEQAYNCQAAVDSQAQIIVAQDVTDAPNDKQQVEPMAGQMKANLGQAPRRVSADSGYYSEANVTLLRTQGIDDYVCPDRLRHNDRPAPAPRGRIPKALPFIDRVRRRLRTKRGRATYGLRKQIVEPVFGQIKHGRGLRQFLLRGLDKVGGEWSLWCTGHNLLKLWVAGAAG
jgi:transposase